MMTMLFKHIASGLITYVCSSLTVCICSQEWVRNLKANSIQPVFANPARQVQRLFEAAQLPQIIGEEFISVRIHDAVTYCQVCYTY